MATKLFTSASASSTQLSGSNEKKPVANDTATLQAHLQKFAKGRQDQRFVAKIHCCPVGKRAPDRTHFSVEAFYKDTGEYAFTLERMIAGIRFSEDTEKLKDIYASNVFVEKVFMIERIITYTTNELPKCYDLGTNNCKHFTYGFFRFIESGKFPDPFVNPFKRYGPFCRDIEDRYAVQEQ